MNLCPGKSVGAIIKNAAGQYLCLYRLKRPIGLAFIAGHIDPEDKSPEAALVREVEEEAGLKVINFKLIENKVLLNPCSRGLKEIGRDYDGHEWFFYEVTGYEGEPQLMEPTKHQFVKFLSREEIKPYLSENDCDPAWLYFLNQILQA